MEKITFKNVLIIILFIFMAFIIMSTPNLDDKIDNFFDFITSKFNGSNNNIEKELESPKIDEGIHKNMDIKLKDMGFIEDRSIRGCDEKEKCLTNGTYTITYGNSIWLTIDKVIKNLKKYDPTDDLLFIGKMYNNEKISTRANIFMDLFKNVNSDSIGFFINIDGLGFYIYASNYSITYDIDNYIVDDDLEKDIDRIDISNASINSNYLLNLVINDFQNSFPYYDFENHYKNLFKGSGISISIHYNNYYYKHYLNTDKIDFNNSSISRYYDTIEVGMSGSVFEGNCIEMIQKDIEYFNKKLNITGINKLYLNSKQIEDIRSSLYSNNEDKKINLNDSLYITINNYDGKYYTIKYEIK